MMKNCLIVGLPDSGKSTYIGALWHVVQNDADKIDLSLIASDDNLPNNTVQLTALSKSWHNVEDMDRTSSDVPNSISLILRRKNEESEFTLNVPDFRGESIRQIVTKNQPQEFDDWCQKADSLLYMVANIHPGIYADDFINDEDDEDDDEVTATKTQLKEVPPLEPKNMTPAALNMLLLRYLKEHVSCKKIVICLSAWDKISRVSPCISPENYLKGHSPALYNFIKYHFPETRFYGLSAQGEAYSYVEAGEGESKKKTVTVECKKHLQDLTIKGERAFIYEDENLSYDITKPLAALLD